MEYSVVIATRNRPDALRASLPRILDQSVRPSEIFVVDSSDDPRTIETIIAAAARRGRAEVTYINSPPGMTLQRNRGLALVRGAVTVFPDDDSILHRDAMRHIMRIYHRDVDRLVGGVCAAEARAWPLDTAVAAASSAAPSGAGLAHWIAARRKRFESRFAPDPFWRVAEQRHQALVQPDWLAAENAVLVPHMTGFRMSFRTEVLRRFGFDENLGRYALFEDVDASLQTLRTHCLVGALNAQIYHDKAPGRRDAGATLGVMHILNRAYVIAKQRPVDAEVIAQIRGYARYKMAVYGLGVQSRFGRERLRGALRAYRVLPQLLTVPPDELAGVYAALRERCLA